MWDEIKFWGGLALMAFFIVSSFLDLVGIADLGWGPH